MRAATATVVAKDVPTRRRRFAHVLGGLTAIHVLVNVLTLVTGPLQARLLGPQGRGELALILVVTGFAPVVASLGLGTFLAREISQTRQRGVLLGTVVGLSVAFGAAGALTAYPVALLFGQGRPEIEVLIFAGMLTLPLSVAGSNLGGAYWGEENWRWFAAMRVLPPLLVAVFFVALWIAGTFTVTAAAIAVFAAGLLSLLSLVPLIRATRGWGFDRAVARTALRFGSKFSVSAIANQGSLRVDQLFVAGLVSARELGFYVVAASLASATVIVSQALNTMIVPMVATGDGDAVRRILRIALAVMAIAAGVLALAAGDIVELLFGHAFADSAGLARVLCFGSVFLVGKGIVSAALVGDGRPGETAVVEVSTFLALIPAMLLVVPPFGAMGAAVAVSAISAAGFAVLVVRTRRWLGGHLSEYLVPRGADVAWFAATLRRRSTGAVP